MTQAKVWKMWEYSGYPISSGNAGKGIERQRAIAIGQSVSSFSNVAKTQYEKRKKSIDKSGKSAIIIHVPMRV